MSEPIATIEALYRYPVKSMAGEGLPRAELGWHGLAGDRRLALRKVDDRGGFPFLTASKVPELVRYVPEGEGLPAQIRTPAGERLSTFGDELAAELKRRHGVSVQMMHFDRGVFDEAAISIIATATVAQISGSEDARRFRPNVVLKLAAPSPFQEDQWVGGLLRFGVEPGGPAVTVTMRDLRCAMLNIDPDTGALSPEMMKAAVRLNANHAGVYCNVLRLGVLELGQPVYFERLP